MIYLDAITVKIRDGAHVINKAAYIAIGVDMDGDLACDLSIWAPGPTRDARVLGWSVR